MQRKAARTAQSAGTSQGSFSVGISLGFRGQLLWLCDGPARAGGIIARPTAKWKQGPPCSKKQDKIGFFFFFLLQLLLHLPWCLLFAVNVLSQVQGLWWESYRHSQAPRALSCNMAHKAHFRWPGAWNPMGTVATAVSAGAVGVVGQNILMWWGGWKRQDHG